MNENSFAWLVDVGVVVLTSAANEVLSRNEVLWGLKCHASGEAGKVRYVDPQENDSSQTEDLKLYSCYYAENGDVFWVITDPARNMTTILLDSEL